MLLGLMWRGCLQELSTQNLPFQPAKVDESMFVTMYHVSTSGPCRIARLVAAALDVHLHLISIDLMDRDEMDPDFIEVNPQMTLPTIVDDGFALWEYNAVARYFVNRYAPGSHLYPNDPQARAMVDQRLDFELSTLYPRFASYFFPMLSAGNTSLVVLGKLEEGLRYLENFLTGQKFVAGSHMTIADLSLVTTVSNIEAVGVSLSKYLNIVRWYNYMKTHAPSYNEINQAGADQLKQVVNELKFKLRKGH